MARAKRRFVVTLKAVAPEYGEDLEAVELHELDHAIEEFVSEQVGYVADDPDADAAVEVATEEVFQ